MIHFNVILLNLIGRQNDINDQIQDNSPYIQAIEDDDDEDDETIGSDKSESSKRRRNRYVFSIS